MAAWLLPGRGPDGGLSERYGHEGPGVCLGDSLTKDMRISEGYQPVSYLRDIGSDFGPRLILKNKSLKIQQPTICKKDYNIVCIVCVKQAGWQTACQPASLPATPPASQAATHPAHMVDIIIVLVIDLFHLIPLVYQ